MTSHGKYFYRSGSMMRNITRKKLDKAILKSQGRTWDGMLILKLKVTDLRREADDLGYMKYLKALIFYDGIQRVEQFMFHQDAFREILLNAIVHKDYSSCNPIQISVYEDIKICTWNDGEMLSGLDSTDKLFIKPSSKPYNPKLVDVFFKSELIEAWGRGFDKIREAWFTIYCFMRLYAVVLILNCLTSAYANSVAVLVCYLPILSYLDSKDCIYAFHCLGVILQILCALKRWQPPPK